MSIKQSSHHKLKKLHQRLSQDALPQLTFLGLIIGVCAGGLIVLFRWAVEIPLGWWLPEHFENFEATSAQFHFWLPFVAASFLGLILHFVKVSYHATGIGHVMDRFYNHQAQMPLGNLITQFLGGAFCLISGQSVGREGPSVHLGAASGSLLSQWMRLPISHSKTLAGCGVAAAIAACFNTPLAGVIFAMEVVVMQYTIVGFLPVTLAAVAGAAITRLVFGPEIAFMNAQMMGDIRELPMMMLVGLVVAIFAAAYIRLHCLTAKLTQHKSVLIRFAVAGFICGSCALFFPQIMGIGFDTIGSAMKGEIALGLLLSIAGIKLCTTSISLGVGMPGGVVGPLLFIGACVGGVSGLLAHQLIPDSTSAIGFYVILGMAAMMGATLNAPLASIMTALELTYNSNIIFPSMLVVVIACLTTRWLFRCEGLFHQLLHLQGKLPAPPSNRS